MAASINFYFNSAGDYASETIEALRTIGAERTASLTKQACDVFWFNFPKSDSD